MRKILVGKGMFNVSSLRAQVWVETVIYTLMGLVIIGILLAAAKPKIEEMKDKTIIEQTIKSMNEINDKIYEVQNAGIGNKRILDLGVSKGELYIDDANNEIGWVIDDSSYKYSEVGSVLPLGSMKVATTNGNPYSVKFFMNYSINVVTVDGGIVRLAKSPTPYRIIIENNKNISISVQ